MVKIHYINRKLIEAGMAIFISDKVNLKTKSTILPEPGLNDKRVNL